MPTILIHLSDNNFKELNNMAQIASMTNESLCSLLISSFLEGGGGSAGGKIHVGSWEKGIRLVINWPKYLIKRIEEKHLIADPLRKEGKDGNIS
jgi:hypothetical protein